MAFFSILLNSNNADEIEKLILNIEETASNPQDVEVIINIDLGDEKCRNAIEKSQKSSKITIKYIETDIVKSFLTTWKSYVELIKLIDKNAYFVTGISSEVNFKTKGWDDVLRKYYKYYDDDIFRIRTSKYRYRNYKDFWECVFAPDSTAFYTKKWIDITGINFHTDSYHQLISFYLTNSREFDHIQYCRDITEQFIEMAGEGSGSGLSILESRKKNIDNVKLWFEAVAPEMQEKTKYYAALLQAAIIMHEQPETPSLSGNFLNIKKPPVFHAKNMKDVKFSDNKQDKAIDFIENGNVIYRISYGVNKFKIFLINNLRKINYAYYSGGGIEARHKGIVNNLYTYYRILKYGDFGYKEFESIKKPKFFDKNKLNLLWFIIKKISLLSKIFAALFFKITKSEKYYRFLRRKINKTKKRFYEKKHK